MSLRRVFVIGVGSELPGDPITNEEVILRCNLPPEITPEFCTKKIGINTRYAARKLPDLQQVKDGKIDPSKVIFIPILFQNTHNLQWNWDENFGTREGCSNS